MKRYFLYAIILGCVGNGILEGGTTCIASSSTSAQLAKIGQ
jgi:hypothetical protein